MLLDLLFPKSCVLCGFLGVYFCHACIQKYRYVERETCLYCRRASLLGLTHAGCRRKDGIDGATSLFHYTSAMKKTIAAIKYRLITDLIQEFFNTVDPLRLVTVGKYIQMHSINGLQPIPLHVNRLKRRGFNQSDYIARFVGARTRCAVMQGIDRIIDTSPQAHISTARERYKNIQGAFRVTEKVLPSGIVLIDDVITTGYTAREVARCLKRSGVKHVFIFSLARG